MSECVLILEDDPDMREALAEVLRDEGYQVHTAARGIEAVELATRLQFDLLVSDIRMEGMSGLDTIEALLQQQPDMGSMVVSGWASEAETLRAVELNVGAYLKKPFSFEQFLQAVRTTLQRRQRPQQGDPGNWGLELLLQVLDSQALAAPRGALRLACQLARRWSAQLGYDPDGQEVAARLTLLRAACELPGVEPPQPVPPWMRGWPESQEPLQWLGLACWTAAGLANPELPSANSLQSHLPPRDPSVWLAYPSSLAEAGQPRQPVVGMLALGHTLAAGGDNEAARLAYQRALEEPTTRLGASLALATLDWRRSDVRGAVDQARHAYQLAMALGPLSASLAACESALLLWRAGVAEGRTALEAVSTWSRRLGLRGPQALVILALGQDQGPWVEQALEVLCDPIYWSESQLAARWLLPELLGRFPQPGLQPFLQLHSEAVLKYIRQHGANPKIVEALGLGESAAPPCAPPLYRFFSLGAFEAQLGEAPISEALWKTQKNKLLLAYLLRYPGQSVHEEQLLEEFWPEDAVRGKRNLYSGLSYVRRSLGRSQEGPETIARQQERLSFNWELPYWCDHEVFLRAAQRGLETESGDDALFHLRRAAQSYRAPYLEGCFMDWALRRREELESLCLRGLARICALLCQRREYPEALEYARRWLELAPHQQEAHLWKMRAHLGQGQPEEVLRQFSRCEKMLRQEYAIEPGLELLEVMLRARHGLPDAADIK